MDSKLLSLAIVLLGVGVTLSAPLNGRQDGRRRRPETRDEQKNYLQKFGHWRGARGNGSCNDSDLQKSVRAFQRFVGLNDTGVVDNETMTIMTRERCGIPDDNDIPGGRRKRYVLSGLKWFNKALTYFIQNFSNDLPVDVTRSDFAKAFKVWSDVSPLTFTESNSNSANIRIRFAVRSHGDDSPFDGPGGVLAHAFYPTVGQAHFDDDETFTHASNQGINLFQVAAHEFGHIMGLGHSRVRNAIMYPYVSGYNPNFQLNQDDVNAIQAIYGKPVLPPFVPIQPARRICPSFSAYVGKTLGLARNC